MFLFIVKLSIEAFIKTLVFLCLEFYPNQYEAVFK